MIPKKYKNHKVLVGPPCRREKDSHGYYSSGDFRVWHVLCDPFILRDDTMEETDEFVMGWEFEDDPVIALIPLWDAARSLSFRRSAEHIPTRY